jgi:hypothetical protein
MTRKSWLAVARDRARRKMPIPQALERRQFMAKRDKYKRKGWMGAFHSVSGISNLGQYEDMYKVGISFRNPIGPFHPIVARKFNLVKYGALGAKRGYSVRKPLWRAEIKERTATKLGYVGNNMPTFDELSLGEAATPTSTTTAVTRNFWGSLTNLITSGAEIFKAHEEAKVTKIQAEIQAREAELRTETTARPSTSSLPWILGIGGGALLVGTLVLRKK